MKNDLVQDIYQCLESFKIDGTVLEVSELKKGHIHDTFVSEWSTGKRYIHQRVNQGIFTNVTGLMENIKKVTEHVNAKIGLGSEETVLKLIPTREGALFTTDSKGGFWRTYDFVEGTYNVSVCRDKDEAFKAARAFGRFLSQLSDLKPSSLIETIPRFQSTVMRYEQFREAIANNRSGRASQVREEIDFCLSHESKGIIVDTNMAAGRIPLRVTHGDLKINNLLFSNKTGEGVCVVDLDTCMPGSLLFDFGDLALNASALAAEDEPDLKKVKISTEYLSATTRGFLQETANFITEAERVLMPDAPAAISLNLGVRFLTDFINGDIYFKVAREGHNLDRARTRFRVFELLLENSDVIRAEVA